MRHAKCPDKLEDTEAFSVVPDIARDLWERGFRPKWAKDVEVGEEIAYMQSMFGFPMNREILTARVRQVTYVDLEGSVLIRHTGPENSDPEDELAECWTRTPMKDPFT